MAGVSSGWVRHLTKLVARAGCRSSRDWPGSGLARRRTCNAAVSRAHAGQSVPRPRFRPLPHREPTVACHSPPHDEQRHRHRSLPDGGSNSKPTPGRVKFATNSGRSPGRTFAADAVGGAPVKACHSRAAAASTAATSSVPRVRNAMPCLTSSGASASAHARAGESCSWLVSSSTQVPLGSGGNATGRTRDVIEVRQRFGLAGVARDVLMPGSRV